MVLVLPGLPNGLFGNQLVLFDEEDMVEPTLCHAEHDQWGGRVPGCWRWAQHFDRIADIISFGRSEDRRE